MPAGSSMGWTGSSNQPTPSPASSSATITADSTSKRPWQSTSRFTSGPMASLTAATRRMPGRARPISSPGLISSKGAHLTALKPSCTARSAALAKSAGVRGVPNRPLLMFAYSGTLAWGSPPRASVRLTPSFNDWMTETAVRSVLTAVAIAKSRLSRRSSSPSRRGTSASPAIAPPLSVATASTTSLATSAVESPAVNSTSASAPPTSRRRANVHSVRGVTTTEPNSTRSRRTGSAIIQTTLGESLFLLLTRPFVKL